MGPYFLMYFVITVIALVNCMRFPHGEKIKRRTILIFTVIIIIVGFRHSSMGHDLPGYIDSFRLAKIISLRKLFEIRLNTYQPGFILLIKVLSMFLPNENWFLFILAGLSIAPVAVSIYNRKIDPYLAALIFIALPSFLMYYSGLRQGLAFGICLLSIKYIEEKKIIKFLLMIALSCTIHGSSWIFILCYFIYKVRLTKKNRFLTLGLIAIVFVFRESLFKLVAPLFGNLYTEIYRSNSFGVLIYLIALYLFEIIFLKEEDEVGNGYANILLMGCLCQTFASVSHMAMRITEYFALITILLVPRTINNLLKRSNQAILYPAFTVAFTLIGIYFFYIGGESWGESYPYYWFWQSV